MKQTIECSKNGTVIICPLFGKLLSCGLCTLCEGPLDDIIPFGENGHWGNDEYEEEQ